MKLVKGLLLFAVALSGLSWTFANAPSFDDNFANYLTDDTPDQYGRVETVFNICIDRNISLMENIRNLFYPNRINPDSKCSQSTWWQLWDVIRVLWFAILFIFLVLAGVQFIMKAKDPDWIKKAANSIMYLGYGAFLVFGAVWILWRVLNIDTLQWSTQLVDKIQNWLFLQILSFFKVLAFFIAIIMMVVYGFRIMASMDQEDKIKTARKWVVNIIIALVLIKIIDYIFYIAQVPEFWQKAADFVLNVAVVLWWIIWALFVFAIFYAGFLLISSSGKEETFKKAKWMIVNIFIVAAVIFLFLLILYQVFNEFV